MQEPKFIINQITINDFIYKLFESRDIVHFIHLHEDSFARHIALDEYYKGIIDLIDGFVESYQGKYGLLQKYCLNIEISVVNPIVYLTELCVFIDTNKKLFPDEWLQNQIQEMQKLLYQTLYKLKNLK